MTIVHLITGLGAGGAEHMVLELAIASKKASIKTIVISVTNSDLNEIKFKNAGIDYHFLGINAAKNLNSGLKNLKTILKNEKDMVLHCHMFHACMLGLIFKVFYKNIPIVYTMHTNNVKQLSRRLLLFFTKSLRKIDIIFSVNSKKWYLNNSIIIQNGVDFSKFKIQEKRGLDGSKLFKFLFLGRLYEPKNPLFLVELVKKLKAKHIEDFVINIVGDGPLRVNLETEIKTSNLERYFILNGFNSNVVPYLHQSHCLILPSLWEGMPVSIIEAAASELPIISTPVGSIPDFLNESNAYIRESHEFHLAMIDVFNNYENALSKANKLFNQMSTLFSIDTVFKQHMDVYKSVN
jgi:glycosyltransferase involved in cell wall biosynthesis